MDKKLKRYNSESEVYKERSKYVPYWDDEKGLDMDSHDLFEVPLPNLPLKDLGVFCLLSRLTLKHSNLIGWSDDGFTPKPMQPEMMAERTNFSLKDVFRTLRRLIAAGLIAKVIVKLDKKKTYYYINPIYFLRGRYVPMNLYFLFQEQLDNVLSNGDENSIL